MNAIIGFSDLLRDGELSEEQDGYIDIIRQSGEHLLQLINDILDFSKIEAGRLDIEMSHCSLKHLFATVESPMRSAAREKGLDFIIRESPGLPANIHTDEGRLRQCLINLINNAIKYSTAQSEIAINAMSDDKSIIIAVSNSGHGISEEEKDKIFNMFYRSEKYEFKNIKGFGLGLAISRRIANILGADLDFNSNENINTFTFKIPLAL